MSHQPIDPRVWRERVEGSLSSVVERAIASVNEMLMGAREPRPHTIQASSIGNYVIAERVADEFRKVGWTVERTDDQRDGCYYTFTAPPSG